jgi:ubiquinone/menaquinone biosynthesis C-methylase UbiE
MMEAKKHWENVYSTKAANAVSWYQEHASKSYELIRKSGLQPNAPIIDVGGGASTLVDDLLAGGYNDITVLDLSGTALAAAKARVGPQSKMVKWLEANIVEIELPEHAYELWHDRAVFHFLNSRQERLAYLRNVMRAVRPGGHVIVATFAEDGPTQCSGLPVSRYSAAELEAEFGEAFTLVRHEKEAHATPFGTTQQFVYCHFRLDGPQSSGA